MPLLGVTWPASEPAAKICVESSTEQPKWYYMVVCGAYKLHGRRFMCISLGASLSDGTS